MFSQILNLLAVQSIQAKVLDPLHSVEARGKVGAIIYNTSRGNKYAKTFASPSNTMSTLQVACRTAMTTTARTWQTITAQQRADWSVWATLHPKTDWTGSTVSWSGFNAYSALNSRLSRRGFSLKATAPVVAGPTAKTFTPTASGSGAVSIAFTAYGGTNMSLEIYRIGPHSAGMNTKPQMAKFLQVSPGETTPIALTSQPVGLVDYWIRTLSEDDGQVSTWTKVQVTVT